jgi:hypothetical protein
MKTAVEWLVEKFMTENTTKEGWHEIFEQAKEMEKEQMIEAFAKGSDEESDYHGFQFITPNKAIEYYNEIFKTNK